MQTGIAIQSPFAEMLQAEIDRFMIAAKERSEYDIDTRRRDMRRYHRSWPLLVRTVAGFTETSAALHNASPLGIAFVCDHQFARDSLVLVKLFWHADDGLLVPAFVRHATQRGDAYLIGGEYALEDDQACRCAESIIGM